MSILDNRAIYNILKPAFANGFQVKVEGDTVFLIGEEEDRMLHHPLIAKVAPLLDGQYTISEIVTALEGTVTVAQVNEIVEALMAQQHLEPLYSFEQIPITQPVSLQTVGNVDATAVITSLDALKVAQAPDAPVLVVLTDEYLNPELSKINEACLATGRSWLLVKPLGNRIWIGPGFDDPNLACWECLKHRLELQGRIRSWMSRQGRSYPPLSDKTHLSERNPLAGMICAREIQRWLSGVTHFKNRILTLQLEHYESQWHALVKRPQCKACGAPPDRDRLPEKPLLQKELPAVDRSGGLRIQTATKTLAQLDHHVDPLVGIVGEITDISKNAPDFICSYTAPMAFREWGPEPVHFVDRMRIRALGKGTHQTQAKVSLIGEAIERYAGLYQGDEACVKTNCNELGKEAIDPVQWMGFSEEQYHNRKSWNKTAKPKQWVPKPFDTRLDMEWTPVWSVTNQAWRYLPAAVIWFGHPESYRYQMGRADSNGMAAGNCMEEALLQGLLEVVERDAVAMWWFHQVQRPGIDIENFQSGFVRQIVDYYRSVERTVVVLDVTNDLDIPVYAAISADRKGREVLYGFGAHVNPETALVRAITELNQSLTVLKRQPGKPGTNWFTEVNNKTELWLSPDPEVPLATLPQAIPFTDIGLALKHVIQKVEAAGMEVGVIDMTRPDLELNTVKVVVPGLRHFFRRLGPGRLYTVPQQMGWIDDSRSEQDVNPYDIYF